MAASDDLLNQWKQEQEFTAAPPQGAAMSTSGSDALLNSWKKDLDSNITISIQNAAKGNPERAAEAQKIARALFVPTETVEKNWDNLSAFAKTRQFQMQREANDDPVLAQMYANPDFAAIGFDDYPNISEAGKAVRNLGKQPERTLGGTGADILVTAGKGIIGTGEAAVGLADIVTKGWVGKQMETYLGYDPKASKEFLETFYSDAQKYANQNVAEAKGILPKLEAALSNPSVIATTIGESIPLMLGGGAIARGLGAMRGLAGSTITRSAIGEGAIAAGSIAEQTRQGDGIPNITIFGEPREEGRLTTEQALASVVGGAATGLIAQIGAKAAQRLGITDIDVLIAGGNTANPALNKSLGRQIIEGGIVEGFFQEMPQSAVEQLVSNYAQGRPVFEGMDDALVMGTLAGIAMGGAGPIVSYPANVRAQREAAYAAEEKARVMQLFADHANASAVLKRDPESFQNYIEQVSEDGNVQNVYIKASVLQQLGVVEELAAAIPAVAEQLKQAATPEQEIQISVADYATKIAPSEANAVLLDNIRVEGETMTRAEATAFIESESETLKAAYDKAQKTQVTYDEFKKSGKVVEADLLGQFNQAGLFTPADNKVQAALYSRVFSILALRMNQTPEQVYEKYKTTIAAEGQVQADEGFDQTLQALTATPEFRQFFEGSKVVDSNGKPLVVYRGMAGEAIPDQGVTSFETKPGLLGTGIYMSGSTRRAEGYARGEQGQMYPLYVSIKNPISEADFIERFGRTSRTDAENQSITDQLIAEGYDGVISERVPGKPWEVVAFNPNQVKSVFNEGSWSPETNEILRQSVSTRLPTAKNAIENPLEDMLIVGLESSMADPKAFAKNVALIRNYVNFRDNKSASTDEKAAEQFIKHVVDNLLWLHDQIPADIRDRSKLWYDGARNIVDDWTQKYNVTDAQAAGMLAVLSPQKDWFQNVSLAERMLDILSAKQGFSWTAEMTATAESIPAIDPVDLMAITGKTLAEVEGDYLKAVWVRVYDQTYNNRGYRVVTPEGDFGDYVLNADGKTQSKAAWGSFSEIGKAVSIYYNGSIENISGALGGQHKVRNFYNNIFNPGSELGDVTIDTHAVAAALLRPLSGNSIEVGHNFGTGAASSSVYGSKGTYGIYAEAYRRAAQQRNILAREMQSITWEAVRQLYTAPFKAQNVNVDKINAVWEQYKKRKLSLEDTRKQILEIAGGIAAPEWGGSSAGASGETWASSYSDELRPVRGAREAAGAGTRGLSGFAQAGILDQEVTLSAEEKALVADIKANGGVSLDKNGNAAVIDSGYVVAIRSQNVVGAENAVAALRDFVKQNEALLNHDNVVIGVFDFGDGSGRFSIDLNAVIPDRDAAVQIGTELDQIAIWDAASSTAIETGGKGGLGLDIAVADTLLSAIDNGEYNVRLEELQARSQVLGDSSGAAQSEQGGSDAASGGRAGSPDQAVGGRSYGTAIADAVSRLGYHFSREPRTSLDSRAHGTGLTGQERVRLEQSSDGRIKKRIYFYVNNGNGIKPEAGVGFNAHSVNLNNLYDIKADPLGIRAAAAANGTDPDGVWFNAVESAIIDAGFDGYVSDAAQGNQGVAVLLGSHAVEVDQIQAPGYNQPAPRTQARGTPVFAKFNQNNIFYSALERAFQDVKQGSMPADQWLKWLSSNQPKLGVKKEEIEATGLREYLELNGKDKLTKEQISQFLQDNGVKIQEVMKGGEPQIDYSEIEELPVPSPLRVGPNDDDRLQQFKYAVKTVMDGRYIGYGNTEQEALSDAYSGYPEYWEDMNNVDAPKYAQWVLPGGENYKELLLTLPAIESGSLIKPMVQSKRTQDYRSAHWDESNILAHIRFNERTDANGKRVLFIEEIQSDWAQAGRKQGFKGNLEAGYSAIDNLNAVPDAPFVKDTKSWVGLSIKRMIRYAAENGFDKVAFVNGKQSADRYNLAKQIDYIEYEKTGENDWFVKAIDHTGRAAVTEYKQTPADLENLVGKEVAQKIVNNEGSREVGEPATYGTLRNTQLEVGGEGMKTFYDKIVPQVANDVLKKLGGGKVEQIGFSFGDKPYIVKDVSGNTREFMRREEAEYFVDENPGSKIFAPDQQLGFEITPAMRDAVMAGQALFQKSRGYIDPKNLIAILTSEADRSTPGHELAHAVVEIYTRIANTEGAPAEIVSDLDQLLAFAGVQGATQQDRLANWSAMSLDEQRPFHEAIAYNWEIYLAEGKAPSVELQSVFDRLSQWIRDLYTVVRDKLNDVYKAEFGKDLPVMTDGVREVFDRMLASQEQIQQAETVRNMQVLFEEKPEGMDDAQWAALQQMAAEARDLSISKLTTDSVRQMRWLSNAKMRVIKQMQRENAALRAEMQQKVEAEIKASPVYKAISYIKDGVEVMADGTTREVPGAHKISIAGLEDLYMGDGDRYALLDWSQLPKNMYGADGMHPDALAELLGFQSGDQLVRTLISAPSLKEAVRVATDARMMEEYGEMNNQRDIDLAVERALHNEARARFVAAELRFVSRATAPARAMIQAAKRAAQTIIAGKLIKDLKPSEYGIAEARANKEAIAAQKKGDNAVVVSSMQTALLNNQLAGVAAETRGEIDKNLVYLRNVTSDRNRKRIGADAADQIDALLSRFDLSMAGSRLKTINEWMAKVTEAGMEPDIAPEMLNENFRKPFKMMTVREFNDLMDAVRQIEHVGRNEQLMLTAAQETAYKAARDEIVASIGVNARGRTADVRTAKTKLGKMAQGLHRFFAEHIKAATVARILDGGKEGPVWEYLIRPANAAADRETAMRAEATRDLTEILAPVLKSKLGGKGTLAPSIGRALNKEERIAIALNMGNDGNIQRLLSGENWTIEQVMPILESLTAAELVAVQRIWDYSETKHKPLIAEQWRRLYGKEPNWVEPRPMTVRTADGQTVELRGGYFPIVYDPRASQRAGELYDAEQARMDMQGFISATISTSFAKSRVAMVKDRPLLLSLAGVYNGTNDVIHALAWQEVIIDANKLLRSYSIDQAIRTTYGPDFKAQLKNWIKDVAVGERASQDGGTNAINFVRQSVSAAGLGFNIMSALQQVTGLSSSIVKLGPQYVGRGVYKTMASPMAAIKMVNAKSSFMANRARTQFRELNELRNMVQGETSVARNIKVGTYLMMAQMQRMVDVPTWIGAYEKAIGQGNDEDRAIALADQAVIDSQGGGMLKDLSKIERGGPWMKLFTVFYSYMNTQFNLMTAEAMTERSKAKLAAKTLMLTIVPVVMAYAIKNGLTPDDEDDWDWEKIGKELVTENIAYLMGMMIIVRELGSAAKIVVGSEGGNRGYGGPAGTRMISDLYSFATQASQGDFDDAFRKSAINLLGDFTGLPSAQINRTINGINALIEGKTSNPAAIFTGFQDR